METHSVELYIYDLSQGLASNLSPLLLGKQLEGIWHTSIVVYNREYFFGSQGVESCNPGTTLLGQPKEVKYLGDSHIPYSVFIDYLGGLSETTYSYNGFLLEQNRKTLREKLAKKERKKEKKRKKILKAGGTIPAELEDIMMAEISTVNGATTEPTTTTTTNLPSEQAIALEAEEKKKEEEKKRNRDPPIVYKELVNVKQEFDKLVELIEGKLSEEEQRYTEELHQYMIGDEGSWALSDGFLDYINRLLNAKEFPVEVKVKILNLLAAAALKDDVILVLHQDRKDHIIMNYAYEIDKLSVEEQEATALFMVNMFENLSSSEWLLYISEWQFGNQQISNIRVTTKVAVHSLLSDSSVLQERGAAIIYNLAVKEVKTVIFDDISVELTMALLQYFNMKPSEEQLFRCMTALSRFIEVSRQEVLQVIQIIGPDPNTFKGASDRIDVLIEQINSRLR